MDVKLSILTETFKSCFAPERFLRFAAEFFGGLKTISPDRENTNIPKEYQWTVESYRHMATYTTDGETLDVFAVKLHSGKGRTVERARSMQRSFISKLLTNSNHDAAVVAFYTDDDPRWRLSFIRLDYEFAAGRVKMNLTPAKRYSYLVGENEPCHTAMAQLYPIFRDDDYNPSLNRIEEAFSVERVTKDFFEQYKEKYFSLKDHLENSDAFNEEATRCGFTSEQFAKKLMGQLAFLYFLQKKGWLGVRVLPSVLTEKEYKNAYYRSKASREIIPQLYQAANVDEFKLNAKALVSLSDEDADIAAGCFKADEWGNGEKAFVRHLFTACKTRNFFDEYLEPLFYEALNHRRGATNFYKRFNCKIPFLNGGLFEPLDGYDWSHNQFDIPNELFSNVAVKGERDADGILDIFDRYNFTMNEDEPLEREVAVDPEMLGKIFENLLDAKDRKSKGAFYTPREIVHYMCAESLVNYLVGKTGVPYDDMKAFIVDGEFMKDEDYNNRGTRRLPQTVFDKLREIDKALETIRVADPAVGSGAFPLGMLSEIVKARNNITYYYAAMLTTAEERARIFEQRDPYTLKWQTIQNCIFAVDIEASAVDIAKLRLWLSLVVDEDLSPSYDELRWGDSKQKDPRPLPNLDYNIMCGNSLIDEFEGIQLFDDTLLGKAKSDTSDTQMTLQMSLFVDSMDVYLEDLRREQERLFGEENQENKHKIKQNIDKIIDNIIRAKLGRDKNTDGLRKYEESLKQKTKPYFLWKLEFARVFRENGGFDVVIGNPPYVKEADYKHLFDAVSDTTFGKRYQQGKMNFWYYFAHKSFELLEKNGYLCFIASNYFPSSTGGKKLNRQLIKEKNLELYIDFNKIQIFENAAVQTMIFLVNNSQSLQSCCRSFLFSDIDRELVKTEINRLNSSHYVNETIISDTSTILQSNDTLVFVADISRIIIDKIDAHFEPRLFKATQGIVENPNVVSKNAYDQLVKFDMDVSVVNIGDEVFVLSKNTLQNYGFNENEYAFLRPYHYPASIGKYYANDNYDHYLLYLTKDNINSIDDFPNIKRHLERYKEIMLMRRETRNGSNKWFHLHWPRKSNIFENEKILYPQMCEKPTFAYSSTEYFINMSANLIYKLGEDIDLKNFTLILNSNLANFWISNKAKKRGVNLDISVSVIDSFPVDRKIIANENLTEISTLIFNNKGTANTSSLEAEIDRIVYKLYGLTEEEIKIVEEIVK